jgi:hypothetical protein
MRKQVLILSAFILSSLIFVSGCSQNDAKTTKPAEELKEQYICPMKCTEEKFDKPGNCPVCGMELEKVANG